MTYPQYIKKREGIAISSAPLTERVKAMEELDTKYNNSNSIAKAQQQIEESKPDTSDIGDHS